MKPMPTEAADSSVLSKGFFVISRLHMQLVAPHIAVLLLLVFGPIIVSGPQIVVHVFLEPSPAFLANLVSLSFLNNAAPLYMPPVASVVIINVLPDARRV